MIIWDRFFGTFERETQTVVFGLTKNIKTFNPLRVAFQEFVAIGRDLVTARSGREALGFLFRHPGWHPEAS